MLASLLPGLRDLRTPLASGYLYLLAVWLILHDHIPKSGSETHGAARSLFELGDLLGKGPVLAGLSFVAYIIGSILLFKPPTGLQRQLIEPELSKMTRQLTPWRFRKIRSMRNQLLTFLANKLRGLPEQLYANDHQEMFRWSLEREPTHAPQYQYILRYRFTEAYLVSVLEDLDAVAIQLQSVNRDFWDSYDRHDAESNFAAVISAPLALCIIGFAHGDSYLWLALLVIPAVLISLSKSRRIAAVDTLIQAIVLNMVVPPILVRLDRFVEDEIAPKDETTRLNQRQLGELTPPEQEGLVSRSEYEQLEAGGPNAERLRSMSVEEYLVMQEFDD